MWTEKESVSMPMSDDELVRLLLRQLEQQEKRIDARLTQQDAMLGEIHNHLSLLNGKVAVHEREVNGLRLWRARAEGAKAAMSWLTPLVTTIAGSGIGALIVLLVHP